MSSISFPAAPNLPLAPAVWTAQYQDQFANVLRLYFNRLSGELQQVLATQGGYRLNFPYGAFTSSVSQTAASTTTAYVVTLNGTDFTNGVSLVDGSKLRVTRSGIYNLQFSIQLNNSGNAPQDIDIWVRQNGTDIPASNSRFGLAPRKSIGDPFHSVAALNLFAELNTNDYLQLVWCSSSTDASLASYPAGTSPTRPFLPSVITTLSFVSALTG
jgi:hypothetical protein